MGIKSQTCTLKWDEESWLLLVVLLQKLKEFSVLSLYRNLMVLNRRALVAVTRWELKGKQLNCCRVSELWLCLPFHWARHLCAWSVASGSRSWKNFSHFYPSISHHCWEKLRWWNAISQTLNPKDFQSVCSVLRARTDRDLVSCCPGSPWLRHAGGTYSNRSSADWKDPWAKQVVEPWAVSWPWCLTDYSCL